MTTPAGPPRLPDDPRPRVLLRPLTADDVAMVRALATDPYVPQTGTLPAAADEQQALDWIERQHEKAAAGRRLGFAVVDVTDGEPGTPVGTCGLALPQDGSRTASGGYAVAPGHRGHGFAALGLLALLDVAAARGDLDEIALFIEAWNTASQRTAERAGFVLTGTEDHPRRAGAEPVTMQRWTRSVSGRGAPRTT